MAFDNLKKFISPMHFESIANASLGDNLNCASNDVAPSDAILAFRTITTILSLIQNPTEIITKEITTNLKEVTAADSEKKDLKCQLRVLDALSAVTVRRHEVVAAVAKPYNGIGLEVLTSVNKLEPALNMISESQHESPGPSRSNWLRWLISPNPRDPKKNKKSKGDSMTTMYPRITLVDPNQMISTELSQASEDDLLNIFLRTEWGTASFDTHIWMLKTLLGRSARDSKTLELYIFAVSFPKMCRRLNEHPLSNSYFNSLKEIKSKTFGFNVATTPPNRDSDVKVSDVPFVKILESLSSLTDITNLLKATPHNVYNEETCREFHMLLCALLAAFHTALNRLKTLQAERVKELKAKTSQAVQDDKEFLTKVRMELDMVRVMASSLRVMISGAAIEKHLKNIAELLVVNNEKLWSVTADSDEDDTDDTEFDALKPYSMQHGKPLLVWQSYKDWLRLTVLYLNAADTLRRFISDRTKNDIDIDIKILAPYLPSKKMLSWKALLRHETYFPELPNVPGQPTGEELITFLTSDFDAGTEGTLNDAKEENGKKGTKSKGEQLVGIEQVLKSVQILRDMQKLAIDATGVDMDNLTGLFDKVAMQVSSMKDCSSPGSAKHTSLILESIQVLKFEQTPKARLLRIQDIADMVGTLSGHSLLYRRLKEDPLTFGDNFSGARHGEICIASVISISHQPHLKPGPYDAILNEFGETGQAIGVSKRCCPVCAHLLGLLKTHDGKKFHITGEHSRITACTLPEWLPAKIVMEMIVEFGGRLRKELVKLQQTTELMRQRASSTDTRRMSLDSMSSRDEGLDNDYIKKNVDRYNILHPQA